MNGLLHRVAGSVREAEALLEDFRRFLGQWRILVMRHRQVTTLLDALDPIDSLLERGHDQRDQLRDLALACEQAAEPFDEPGLAAAAVTAIRHAAARTWPPDGSSSIRWHGAAE